MRETRSSGSVRGASGDGRSYRKRISAFDGSRRRAANHPLCGRSLRGRNNRSWAACVPGIPSL
jgi:hypothetical protein